MNRNWIDEVVSGVFELCATKDIFEIYDYFGITINEIDKDSFLLMGSEAVYIRDYFNDEVVFIKEGLPFRFKKFILAHELGHALLHMDVTQLAYNSHLIVKGKHEKEADYFAIRILGIELNKSDLEGITKEQAAKMLYISDDSLEYLIENEAVNY